MATGLAGMYVTTAPGRPQAVGGLQNRAGFLRFSPFDMNGGSLLFFTFDTQIDYGLILKNSLHGRGPYHRAPQMWMAAVDIDKLGSGQDASFAPTWVPLQSTQQKNHFGCWTEKLLCTSDVECGVCETCIDEECVPELSCVK